MRSYCESGSKSSRASFILECLSGANPKSDEEPEDWMPICMGMAVELFCEDRPHLVTYACSGSAFRCNVVINETQIN